MNVYNRFTQDKTRNRKTSQLNLTVLNIPDSAKSDESKPSVYTVPFWYGLVFTASLLATYGICYLIANTLPTPLLLADEQNYPDAFIAERAQKYLKGLTDFGPRVVGSPENEILTVNYLKNEIKKIKDHAHKSQKIELDVQVVSGAFDLDNVVGGRINVYSNVQNVVVKLYSKSELNNSLLLNVHFDSVPTSPGATDDGIGCAILLEILRKISSLEERPLHNVIFLFNGAEESPLQAAHGFVTQHKWAHEVKNLINLEAAGSGGSVIMFQSGPDRPWIAKAFGAVPHPQGNSLAEEIFHAKLIPSDTDFRLFRDFGDIRGLDMTFLGEGTCYHTKYDTFDRIQLGSYQNGGDNIMALVQNLMNNPELSNENPEKGSMVFYDYMLGGLFISYSTSTAYVLNIVVVLSSVAIFLVSLVDFKLGFTTNTLIYLIRIVSAVLSGWILAGLLTYLVGLTLDFLGYPMSWYANNWLVVGLYVVPTSIGMSSLLLIVIPKKLGPNVSCHMQAHVIRLIWTILTLLTTVMRIRSSYIFMNIVFFNTLTFIVIHLLRLQHSTRWWQVIYFGFSVLPTIFLMGMAKMSLEFYMPTVGRLGNTGNPETLIGFITCGFTLLVVSQFVSFISLLRKPYYFLISLGVIFLSCFLIVLTPLGFPYSGNYISPAPQRFWISHSQRIFHGDNGTVLNRDSGYFILNMDRNSPRSVKSYVKEMASGVGVQEDCNKYLLCGLPLPHPKMFRQIKGSTWIPAEDPILSEPIGLKINSKELFPKLIRYNITVSGPDRIFIFLSPKENMTLLKTSLMTKLPAREGRWNGRPLFFIIHSCGKELVPLEFTLDFAVPQGYNGVTMNIAIAANYVHAKKNKYTSAYQTFLSQFPDWADVTAWLAAYETWTI